ncbi:MAG TPA: DUF6384 family protein [Afifellaceae bacterium]|nr:DUF6384 family protein [Afifellaceae bacterium]
MSGAVPGIAEEQSLDEVMLAMDVVDTLRHEERMVRSDLSADEREADLIERLRKIYKSQGIDVPDSILRDGVKALEEKRFVYEPPKRTFATRLATLYVTRERWLKPLIIAIGILIAIYAAYYFLVQAPRQAAIEQRRIELTQILPGEMKKFHAQITAIAEDADVRARADALFDDGKSAVAEGDHERAAAIRDRMDQLFTDLSQTYTIRIVSRPGKYSGIFRVPDDNPGGRNYYLIVEAVDAEGTLVPVLISSEEDQTVKRTTSWGVRVSEEVFNAVADDKADDQIIQAANIGIKRRGVLEPDYAIPVMGGRIVEW